MTSFDNFYKITGFVITNGWLVDLRRFFNFEFIPKILKVGSNMYKSSNRNKKVSPE